MTLLNNNDNLNLNKGSMTLLELQSIYNQVIDQANVLQNEKESFFSLNKELKGQKIILLNELARSLETALYHSEFINLKSHGNVEITIPVSLQNILNKEYSKSILDGRTGVIINSLKKIIDTPQFVKQERSDASSKKQFS